MKHRVIAFALASMVVASISHAADGKEYGKGLTLDETTRISDILEHPDELVGKKVQVSGTVIDVCPRRGCWMEIAGDKPFEKIRVKVEDGEIVFPMTAKGHSAVVEGEVERIDLTKEQVCRMKEYQAKEEGKEFDPASVTGGEAIYRIRGLGAAIEE